MDDIPKITLKPVQATSSAEVSSEKKIDVPVEQHEPDMAQKKRFPIVPVIFLVMLLLLVAGGYAVFTKYIVWDDGTEIETSSSSSAYIPVKLPPAVAGESSSSSEVKSAATGLKGKITTTIMAEGGKILPDAIVRLVGSSGKTIKEVETGKTGIAVFDGIPAGTYKVEGGKKGEKRVTSQSVSLTDGEIKEVTLSIFLDTPVTITVYVKKPDGTAVSDKTFTLRKIRSSEDPLDFEVTTNNFGMFTKSEISPDDGWLLLQEGVEVATFSVAPTGKNQTINVQTKSN